MAEKPPPSPRIGHARSPDVSRPNGKPQQKASRRRTLSFEEAKEEVAQARLLEVVKAAPRFAATPVGRRRTRSAKEVLIGARGEKEKSGGEGNINLARSEGSSPVRDTVEGEAPVGGDHLEAFSSWDAGKGATSGRNRKLKHGLGTRRTVQWKSTPMNNHSTTKLFVPSPASPLSHSFTQHDSSEQTTSESDGDDQNVTVSSDDGAECPIKGGWHKEGRLRANPSSAPPMSTHRVVKQRESGLLDDVHALATEFSVLLQEAILVYVTLAAECSLFNAEWVDTMLLMCEMHDITTRLESVPCGQQVNDGEYYLLLGEMLQKETAPLLDLVKRYSDGMEYHELFKKMESTKLLKSFIDSVERKGRDPKQTVSTRMSFVEAMASPILFLDRILDSAKRILESVTADLPHASPHLVGPALLAHPDAGNRLWYIESVEEAIESCKENAKAFEQYFRLLRIRRSVKDAPSEFLRLINEMQEGSTDRKLLKEGVMQKQPRDRRSAGPKTRYMMLFSDVLVYCVKGKEFRICSERDRMFVGDVTPYLSTKGMMWLSTVSVDTATTNSLGNNKQFVLIRHVGEKKERTYTMTLDSAEERDEWLELLAKACPKYDPPPQTRLPSHTVSGGTLLGNRLFSPSKRESSFGKKGLSFCLNEEPPTSTTTMAFLDDGQVDVSSTGLSGVGAVDLSIQLITRLLALYHDYAPCAVYDEGKAADLISRDERFQKFQEVARELHYLPDLHELSDEERMIFFLNVSNALVLHANVVFHRQLSETNSMGLLMRWTKRLSYVVGGTQMQFDGVEHSPKLGGVISLFTMQQSLLRASLSVMNCSEVDPASVSINERDSVYPLRVVSSSSNLLNFAISENTTASPNIRIYTRENLKKEIRANAFEFVHRTVRFYFQGDVLKVVLPPLFRHYWSDFGGDVLTVLMFIKYFLPRDVQTSMYQIINRRLDEIQVQFDDEWRGGAYPVGFNNIYDEASYRPVLQENNVIVKQYMFPLLQKDRSFESHEVVCCTEELSESAFSFAIAREYAQTVRPLRERYVERCAQAIAEQAEEAPEGIVAAFDQLAAHIALMNTWVQVLDEGRLCGMSFRPSTYKKEAEAQCLPINLHLQRFSARVAPAPPRECGIVTFGAAAAHMLKFKADLRSMFQSLASATADNQVGDIRTIVDCIQRVDSCFPQILAAVATSFAFELQAHADDVAVLEQYAAIGFYVGFESLLSTHGGERGMLGDFSTAVELLRHVLIDVRCGVGMMNNVQHEFVEGLHMDVHEVSHHGCPVPSVRLLLYLKQEYFNRLPNDMRQKFVVPVVGVLFTQGINEQQSMAIRMGGGECKLQEDINYENVSRLEAYYREFLLHVDDSTSNRELAELMTDVKVIVATSKNEKNVELLPKTADIARIFNGGRCTSCKSAKDRTSMSITWEQSRMLSKWFSMDEEMAQAATEIMRIRGVRLENCFKNIGSSLGEYSIALMVPVPVSSSKNPKGTGGGGVAT